jgi:hypothetical protein
VGVYILALMYDANVGGLYAVCTMQFAQSNGP